MTFARSKPSNAMIMGLLAVGLVVASLALFLAPVHSTRGPASGRSAGNVTNEQLRKFSLIFGEIGEIQAALREKIKEAPDERAMETAEQKARADMVDAVRRNGMNVEEFNRLARLLVDDLQLFERFQAVRQGLCPQRESIQ